MKKLGRLLVILGVAAATFWLLTAPLRRHRALPAALARIHHLPENAVLIYHDEGGRKPRVAITGASANLLLDCGVSFDGRQLIVNGCELADGATIDDVLNVLGSRDDDGDQAPAQQGSPEPQSEVEQ